MKLVILGNGISCQLFLSYLQLNSQFSHTNWDIFVLEKNVENIEIIDDVPFYFNNVIEELGDIFEPITVEMGIYDNNKIYYEGSDLLSRKYSEKILGVQSKNTITNLQKSKQAYIVKKDNKTKGRKMALYSLLYSNNDKYHYIYNFEVIKIDTVNKILFSSNNEQINYDFLISTIPLNNLMSVTGLNMVDLITVPFYIHRVQIEEDNIYKVLYCTDEAIRFSRMAKLNDVIYLETRNELTLEKLNDIENEFCSIFFDKNCIKSYKCYLNYPGRFSQLDDKVYYKIVDEFLTRNIFLLGRMANWRFKLVENIFEDCKEIYQCLI